MVNGKYSLVDLTTMDTLTSMEGRDIFIKTNYHEVKINDALIIFEDISLAIGNMCIKIYDPINFIIK